MRSRIIGFAALLGAAGVVAMTTKAVAQETKASHVHMGHVLDGWRDTPEQKGLLPTANDEAQIALRHAGLAVSRPDNLAAIKTHIGHVMNAIDPSVETAGPGKGYGVIKAAQGVATHCRLAANTDDASDNVKLHATHVGASANNVAAWGQRIMELGNEVKAAETAAAAAELAEQIQALTEAISSGQDANEDGRIGWGEGEGGLAQAARHMDLMKRGEGTN